jgi:hypothetical protein
MTSYGSDYTPITQQSGDLVADGGATLISPRSEGETAIMAGPALLREIQAGVANGDFAVSPQDPTATITEENNLPYWTYTDVNSDGAITCAVVSDASTASGNVLRWSVAGGTTTGKSATLTRFMPIAGSRNRSFAYASEANFLSSATSSTVCSVSIAISFATSEYAATGSSATESVTFTDVALGLNYIQAPRWELLSPDSEWLAVTVPADAAYAKITLTVSTTGTVSAGTKTLDCAEVRVMTAGAGLIMPDLNDPTIGAGAIWQNDGRINIAPVMSTTDGTYARIFLDTILVLEAPIGVFVDDGAGLDGELTAGIVNATTAVNTSLVRSNATTTSDLSLQATGSDIIVQDTNAANGTNPRILFRQRDGTYTAGIKSGAANVIQILNGSSATDYAQLWAERIYPMNGSTASRYIYDTGSLTGFSAGIDVNGTVNSSNLVCDSIPTTTNTTNNAVWVFNAGTNYTLRRFTSSQRYKTNIVDVDEVVLEAAKKIKPRHFTSTLPDENGATRLGFIAEEIEAAGLTHAIGYDGAGRVETLDSMALIAALYARVNDLEQRLADLESR